ncbi:MAG TPA: ABC transporter permease [Chloroflexota bacterium]|jgi:ABC-type dipeptide/oligopeptide/nickel transport system permease subunit
MTTTAAAAPRLHLAEKHSRTRGYRRFARVFFNRPLVVFGSMTVLLLLLAALIAPLVAPYDPYEQNLGQVVQDASPEHWLGTDTLGRDTLSRIIFGSRIALLIGLGTVAMAATIGTTLGLVAAYFGGWVFTVIMRFTDAMMAIPALLMALVISTLLGSGVNGVLVGVGLALMPGYVRLMAGQVLSAKQNEYVIAARAIGAGQYAVMFRHILPNCLSPLIVQVTLVIGLAILIEATLSFLGVGIKPPTAAWGSMVYDGYRYLALRPILSLGPGLAIMLVVFGFNMIGDGLRDALDPRLRNVL